jgi:transcriptional regulator with XRE-family HTH domain
MSSGKRSTVQRESPDLKALGRRLRELRGFDLTQEESAKELGVSQSQLSKYERGFAAPSAEVLFFVKKRFRVSIDWLLTGEGERS